MLHTALSLPPEAKFIAGSGRAELEAVVISSFVFNLVF